MSALANSVQKPERFDVYVRKFRSICVMHGVQTGSRKDLPVFLRKLIDDRHLAMDFWGFVGKLSNRENGPLSDDQMLGVIVEGITNSDISEQDGGAQRTIDDLRAMLAGVDIQGPEHRQMEMAPFPKRETASPPRENRFDRPESEQQLDKEPGEKQQREKEAAEKELDKKLRAHAEELAKRLPRNQTVPANTEEQAPRPVEKQAPVASAAAQPERTEPAKPRKPESSAKVQEELHYGPVLPATPAPQLDEALLRLELTRLVKEYFDNIDKRISKLEPPGEGTIAPPVTRRSLEEPISPEEMEELRLRRMGRARLVLDPAPTPVEDAASSPSAYPAPPSAPPAAVPEDDDVPMRVPLEHYSPPPVYGRAPFLLLLLLVGAGIAIYRDPTILRKGVAVVARQFHTDGGAASSNRSATASAPSAPPVPVAAQPSQPSALESTLEGNSTATSSAPEQQSSSPVTPPAAQPTSRPAANDSESGGRPTASDRVVAETQQAVADGMSSIASAGAVNVSPSVMDENLIVQRVPAYPESAKLSGVHGDVVMQALISKEGTVKRVHVVEGDSRLRTAAEEAVYKWRYRPYVLHGQPVEVATTVTVNFNLNR